MPRITLGQWAEDVVNWLTTHIGPFFDFISTVVNGMYNGVEWVLGGPTPLLMAGILAVIAFWMRGLLAGVLTYVGFALIDSIQQWDAAMQSLALTVVAGAVAIVLAVPIGIWAARKRATSAVIRPILDVMQTLPAFVYLIPAIIFFSLGTVPAVIATIVFAMPVGVRMTELGIRQVDEELVEAADAFGTPPGKTLLRVQLPLALPTIMAGVNQVIMLALSMVVIGGMVGADGLGKVVYGAISQVNIGLGFEGGVSVVILAIFLDRITGALGDQVSPLGRRALAKLRASVHGLGVIHYRPRPAVGVAGVVILALVAGGLGLFGGNGSSSGGTAPTASANVGKGQAVKIGSFNWDESIASANLWKAMLDARGFKASVNTFDPGAAFTGLSTGSIDYLTDAWLPTTHASYMKQYGKNYTDLGKWYDQTSLEVSVPSYVKGVKTMADLKGKSKEFGGKIIGIEPGAGEMGLLKSKVLPGYGLDKEYQLVSGSTAGMLAELKRDYAQKKPVAVVLWTPHWAYSKYQMTKLSDPKGLWGKGDSIHNLANKTSDSKLPQVSQWMKNFHMTESQLSSLEASIQDAGQGQTAKGVQDWMKKNPGVLDKFTPLPGQKVNVGKGASVRVGGFNGWDESIATAALWQAVLEDRGYKVTNNTYDAGAGFTGLSRGNFDFLTDAWLPTTHAAYWKQYGSKLDKEGKWFDQTSLEVSVPSYVKGVKTMADLKGKSKEFGGKIIGIEPGAGEMGLLKSKVLPGYGLDKEYKLVSGSTAGMLAELKRDYAQKKPVAVVLWTPHWAYSKFSMTKLSDPKGLWGKGDSIYNVANKNFAKSNPTVTKWLQDFRMTEPQLSSLEASIQDAGQGKVMQGVRNWMKKNPSIVDTMAPAKAG
ncbi:glycine/betaine ABC transporter permease [Mangrovactinospora gilvigrisea]|uniref:Glycine/betaine ABC transporter permease n=1 Tax=Mangrovactinospora gilvigrisea TaxID=1428644 RepID=A0A1J7BI97_9ACTN|nr:ABC transporter permease/substrate binding protein [Mangrovactinospora gilvigrisea]OIV38387.1 glycine/betaine ABC transporter permease [Mangrovactinospora gilvigrisea]